MAVPMEAQLQSIFEEVVKTEVIEEAFPGMFMDTPEDERTKLISCLSAFRQFWSNLSQESHEQCVQWIVRFIHSQHSPKRISFLYDCLAMAVETGLLPPRMVCESLLNSDNLEWERTQLWSLTFKLVQKIIGGVDYKAAQVKQYDSGQHTAYKPSPTPYDVKYVQYIIYKIKCLS
ncbi:PREDICTED: mediator of RNA polymerase II transcription subunit 23-like [Thamnophis sirtalis]|uniref:Mediator of RNA polymerase II transcription subunit 23 n=1 Tax=Thamnophis sirtalis TaxID=35019 RepID=A0A6I9XUK5_9SAUR|nr:PREDICTED: mediator of RNA polymerase II transcription subunit 23-like [Thamnophis sirtalis]